MVDLANEARQVRSLAVRGLDLIRAAPCAFQVAADSQSHSSLQFVPSKRSEYGASQGLIRGEED